MVKNKLPLGSVFPSSNTPYHNEMIDVVPDYQSYYDRVVFAAAVCSDGKLSYAELLFPSVLFTPDCSAFFLAPTPSFTAVRQVVI